MDPQRLIFIDEIFKRVVRDLEENESRLSMALCCRAFLETALDALWGHSLEGIRPLVLCLPQNALSTPSGGPFDRKSVVRDYPRSDIQLVNPPRSASADHLCLTNGIVLTSMLAG